MDNKKQFVKNLKMAWRDEMLSARNYRALAEHEQHPEKKQSLSAWLKQKTGMPIDGQCVYAN
jgi:hypothetical protein